MLIQVGEAKPRASKSRKLKCLIQTVIIIIIIIILIIITDLTQTVGWAKVGMVSAMRSWSQGATLYSCTQSHVSHYTIHVSHVPTSWVLWSTLRVYPRTLPSSDISLSRDWLPTWGHPVFTFTHCQ